MSMNPEPAYHQTICGLDLAKKAMAVMAVDPEIRGLLIRGQTGVGKTALVRAMSSEIYGRESVIIPLNCSDEQAFGGLDIATTLSTGKATLSKGILARADGGVVSMDDVNLADRGFVHTLMNCINDGIVHVERDGVSASYSVDTRIVAMMNLHESKLPAGLADLFDLSVTIPVSRDPDFKTEVMKCNLEGREESVGEQKALIDSARELLPLVEITDDMLNDIAEICCDLGVQGHRGDLACVRAVRAVAAINGHRTPGKEDLDTAVLLTLGHRRTRLPPKDKDLENVVNFYGDSHMKRFIHDDRKPAPSQTKQEESAPETVASPVKSQDDSVAFDPSRSDDSGTVVSKIGEMFEAVDLIEECRDHEDAIGKRRSMRDESRHGRCISSRPFSDGGELHVDATIRHAAPYQPFRERRGDCIALTRDDLMEKVREKRTSCLFLFMIDNSGSLVIRGRMRAVKASILSMLATHYVRRDSVGIMTFNEESIGMIVPPTRSVGSIKGVLETLPVGRKTPLSEALVYADDYISRYSRKHPGDTCYVILMSDAGANISMTPGADPFEESMQIARGISRHDAAWILVDTSANPDKNEKATKLADALGAPYYKMDSLRKDLG